MGELNDGDESCLTSQAAQCVRRSCRWNECCGCGNAVDWNLMMVSLLSGSSVVATMVLRKQSSLEMDGAMECRAAVMGAHRWLGVDLGPRTSVLRLLRRIVTGPTPARLLFLRSVLKFECLAFWISSSFEMDCRQVHGMPLHGSGSRRGVGFRAQ